MPRTLQFLLRDEPHTVEFDHARGQVEITVGGKTHTLRVVGFDQPYLFLQWNGRKHRIAVLARGDDTWVGLPGRTFQVSTRSHRGGRGPDRASHGTVMSPITGRVAQVLLEDGQPVEVRQAVLVIEAMKMENRVLAPVAGIVRNIRVRIGDGADMGQPLFDVLPGPGAEAV